MAPTMRRAGQYVPEPDFLLSAFDHVITAVQRLWCWREFSVPLAAVIVGSNLHNQDVGGLIVFAVVGWACCCCSSAVG